MSRGCEWGVGRTRGWGGVDVNGGNETDGVVEVVGCTSVNLSG